MKKYLYIVLIVFISIPGVYFFISARQTLAVSLSATSNVLGGNWSSPSTWVGGVVPGDNYDVSIVGPVVIDQDIGTVGGGGIRNIRVSTSAGVLSVDNSVTRTILFASTGTDGIGSGSANSPGTDGNMFGLIGVSGSKILLVGSQSHPVILNSANGTGKIFIRNVWASPFTGADLRIIYGDIYNLGINDSSFFGINWGTTFEGPSNFLDIENTRFNSPYMALYLLMIDGAATFTSNYITGRSGPQTITVADNRLISITVTDNTEVSPAASGRFFMTGGYGLVNTNCSRNALSGTPSFFIGGCRTSSVKGNLTTIIGNTVNNNLIYNYPNTINLSGGVGNDDLNYLGCGSLTDAGDDTVSICNNNISENQFHAFIYGGGTIANNFVITGSSQSQGSLFLPSASKTNLTHNIFKYRNDPTGSNLMLFTYGSLVTNKDLTIDHNTIIGQDSSNPANNNGGIVIGEPSFPTATNIIRNNLVGNINIGISDYSSGNTFAQDYNTFGVHHNDVYSFSTAAYSTYADFGLNQISGNTGNHFDDGVHIHPNAVYGDITADPQYFDSTRESITQYDVIIGGPGTAADFFTKLSYRSGWGGTNTLGSNPIEDARAWLFAGYAPTNVAVSTAASDGTTMGAVAYTAVNNPIVTSQVASSVGLTTVTLNGTITSTGGAAVTTEGFEYGLTTGYGTTATNSGSFTTGAYTKAISGLACGTLYHYRASVTNSSSLSGVSSDATFTTNACAPGSPTSPSSVAGTSQATVVFVAPASNGGSAITGYTVTSIPSGGTDSNAGSTSLSHVVTGLTNGTSYTFTVHATNIIGNSSESIVTSPGVIPGASPTLTLQAASSITQTGATLNATVTVTGGINPTIEGFEYGLSTSYGTTASLTGSFSVGAYTQSVSSLVCNITYHYRAFATNIIGTTHSSDDVFTTSTCPSSFVNGGHPIIPPAPVIVPQTHVASAPTLVQGNYNFGTKTLTQVTNSPNSKGESSVKDLQRFLNSTYKLKISTDGIFGKGTKALVKKWQADHGLTADGVVGPKTKELMLKSVK
ncbi:MAG: peptidoglycan-binding protein [bacterium]